MSIAKGNTEIRSIKGITKEEEKKIIDFLQGAVYIYTKNNKDEFFGLRDLMGGQNFDWNNTPLYPLYLKHSNKSTAVKDAGKDAGWILKKVISIDQKQFETQEIELTRKYRLI